MIDWHCHILPGIDDGSRDEQESIALLDMQSSQGVKTAIATPHFHADHHSVGTFLQRRNEAYARIEPLLKEHHPEIRCGAEVHYYPGISRMERLRELCIQGSSVLLLEMDYCKWTEYTVKELVELASRGNLTLAIAHLERYMGYQSEDTLYRLYESGIYMQFNASFFLSFGTKRKALHMLLEDEIHLIGSDCHSMRARPPRMEEVYQIIGKKLGKEIIERVDARGHSLLNMQIQTYI